MTRALLVGLLALAACNQAPPAERVPGAINATGEVLVTVDGQTITQGMVDAMTAHIPKEKVEELLADPKTKQQLMDKLVLGEILYVKALEREVHKLEHVSTTLAMAEREVLAQRYLELIATEGVTEEAVQAEYDKNKIRYHQPQTKLMHMVVKQEDLAKQLVEQLKAGGDFAALAREHSSDGRTRDSGGDMGWVARAPIPELAEPMEGAAVGDILGPIESRFGFHVVKIEGKRDKTPIDDVRPALEQGIKQKIVQEYTTDLRKNAKVEFPGDASAEAVEGANVGDGAEPETTPPAEADHGHDHAAH